MVRWKWPNGTQEIQESDHKFSLFWDPVDHWSIESITWDNRDYGLKKKKKRDIYSRAITF